MSIILADIGATNARFAVLQKGKTSDIYQFACDDFKNPETMINSFKNAYAPTAKALVMGVAGVVLNDEVRWTNRKWVLNAEKLKKKMSLKKVVLKNDVEVQCGALPLLKKTDFVVLQKGEKQEGPKVLMSLGTGLGVGYFINGTAFATEYGQTTALTDKTLEKTLLPMTGKQGFVQPYQMLAKAAMNLALTLKPMGGLYLYGRMLDEKLFKRAQFVACFNRHPNMQRLLKTIPLILIIKENIAFIGLKELAKKYDLS